MAPKSLVEILASVRQMTVGLTANAAQVAARGGRDEAFAREGEQVRDLEAVEPFGGVGERADEDDGLAGVRADRDAAALRERRDGLGRGHPPLGEELGGRHLSA